jgi:predicted secreted protein
MSLATAIAIYFVIWWVVLFTVLPWGVRSQEEGGDVVSGSDPGAPMLPRLWWKLVWTTIIAGVVFALFAFVYVSRLVTFDDLVRLFGLPTGGQL